MTTLSYILLGVLTAAIVIFLLAILPRIVVPELPRAELASVADHRDRLTLRNERAKMRNEFRTTCVSFLSGLGLIAGVLVAFGQFRSSQDALANSVETSRVQLDIAQEVARNEQFVATVENLGDDNFAVRVAAVEVLDDIAQQGGTQAIEANSILRAVVQERSPWPPREGAAHPAGADTSSMPMLAVRSPEVHVAMRRLGERAMAEVSTTIGNTDLRRADLRGNDYTDDYFGDVHLGHSQLGDANFTRAIFDEVDLSFSDLRGAKLCGAWLATAALAGAQLEGAIADGETSWPDGFDWEAAGVLQADGADCTR